MARRRPKALVTAPVAGPGLDLLRQVADVVVDPWIDHQPLRIYNAEQLAERAAEEDANLLDRRGGPLRRAPVRAGPDRGLQLQGRPQQRRRRRRHQGGGPGAPCTGPERRRRGRARCRLVARRDPGGRRSGPRRQDRRRLQGRHHPLPALQGMAARRENRRARRSRSSGQGHQVAPRGSRHARHRGRPVRLRRQLPRSTSCSNARMSSRCTWGSTRTPSG